MRAAEPTALGGTSPASHPRTALAQRPVVLVVDDEPRSVQTISRILDEFYELRTATSAAEALQVLEGEAVQVVISDQRMPDMTGVELLTTARSRWPEVLRIIVTGFTDAQGVISAINDAGIYHFIAKPWHPDELLQTVRNATELYRLQRDHERLSLEMKLLAPALDRRIAEQRRAVRSLYRFEGIVRSAESPLNEVCARAAQIARFDIPVVITGATGTGKELFARAIHYASLRSDRPFHAFNCGAIPDDLLESELFGHKKGSFTGAHTTRIGLLEQADQGTVFLDEIGDISPAFQVKLLRFLQEREIRPVGSNETRRVDVRVIAATHRDLEEETRAGRMRQDLYYRLTVAAVRLPSLSERACDVPLIAAEILDQAMRVHGKRVRGFTEEAMELLQARDWPGNVRELQNEVVRMLVLAEDDVLHAGLLSPPIRRRPEPVGEDGEDDLPATGGLRDRLAALELRVLKETLGRHRWNKTRAAQELGLSRLGLRNKLVRFGLEPATAGDDGD